MPHFWFPVGQWVSGFGDEKFFIYNENFLFLFVIRNETRVTIEAADVGQKKIGELKTNNAGGEQIINKEPPQDVLTP